MFEVLLESRNVRPSRSVVATAFSAAVHASIIMAAIAGTAVVTSDEFNPMVERIAAFLVPPDRASKPGEVSLAYTAASAAGSPRGALVGSPVRVEEESKTGEPVVPQQAAQAAEVTGVMQLAEAAQAVGAFSIIQVDSAAERDPLSAAPTYPKDLLTRNIEGSATLRFVIDSTGLVDLNTIKVIGSTHNGFARAVQEVMPRMRFRPAMMGSNPVRQLAEQQFKFQITAPLPTATSTKKP